jgi:[methyl-Co(III) methanol-specific corrinoid protein]:coenzyme M methyltransferase
VGDVLSSGRVQVVASAIKKLKEQYHLDMAVNAFMVPPFTSVSSYLMDTMNFYVAMKRNPKLIKDVLEAALPVYVEIAKVYQEAGADMITLHEMGASTDNIAPASFQEFSAPYVTQIVKAVKIPVVLNICGRADPIAAKMADTGAAGIAFDEKTDLVKVKEGLAGRTTVVAGNIPPRDVLHNGPVSKIEEYVRKSVDNGVTLVGSGCDFWIETPSAHIKAMVDSVTRINSRN